MNSELYIKKLIAEGEHQQQDFKYEVSDAKKIARTLVAFANTDGGRLLIGVKDNGKVTGIKSDEEIHMIETASLVYCYPPVEFTSHTHPVEEKQVLEINVKPSNKIPHYAPDKNNNKSVYIRVKDENQIANNVITKVLKSRNNDYGLTLKYTTKEKDLLKYIETNGWVSFLKAKQIIKASSNKTETILASFISLNMIEAVFNNNKITYQIKTSGNFIPQ